MNCCWMAWERKRGKLEQFKIGAVFTELDAAAVEALERFATGGS